MNDEELCAMVDQPVDCTWLPLMDFEYKERTRR
jgi:hypothetical protein